MANKEIKTRIQNKNDTSENWAKAVSFIPLKGEIIVYTDLRKIKIGDGVTKVGALEFANSKDAETLTGASLSTILNHSDVEIPTSKAVLDALDGKVPNTRTVNGKALSTNITLSASDVHALPNTTSIPTKTSELTNDSSFVTQTTLNTTIETTKSKTVSATLFASNWTGASAPYTYTLAVTGVTASSNGSLRIAQSATDEQFTAWGAAQLRVTAQAAGTLTVKAAGTVPTIDIPVEVLIV